MMSNPKPEYITIESLKKVLNETLEKNLNEKLKFVKEIHKDHNILRTKVAEVETRVKTLENYSRRNNVVIQGIPFQKEENPLEVAISAGELVGVNLDPRDIDIAHRFKSKNDKLPPPFIIKLVNRHKKIEIISQARRIKPTGEKMGGDQSQVEKGRDLSRKRSWVQSTETGDNERRSDHQRHVHGGKWNYKNKTNRRQSQVQSSRESGISGKTPRSLKTGKICASKIANNGKTKITGTPPQRKINLVSDILNTLEPQYRLRQPRG